MSGVRLAARAALHLPVPFCHSFTLLGATAWEAYREWEKRGPVSPATTPAHQLTDQMTAKCGEDHLCVNSSWEDAEQGLLVTFCVKFADRMVCFNRALMSSSLSPRNRQAPASQGLGWVGTNSSPLYTRLGFFILSSSEACAVSASCTCLSKLFSWKVFPPTRRSVPALQRQPMVGPAGISSSMLFCLCKQAAAGPCLVCWSFSFSSTLLLPHPALGSTASSPSSSRNGHCSCHRFCPAPTGLGSLTQSDNSVEIEALASPGGWEKPVCIEHPTKCGVSGHIFLASSQDFLCRMSEIILCRSQEPDRNLAQS